MNRHVNAISGRLSLRQPQRDSLQILDRICEIIPPTSGTDLQTALTTIKSEYLTVTDFECDFSSLCFALGRQSSPHGGFHLATERPAGLENRMNVFLV